MKEALPQMIFIVVLVINLLMSLIDSNRNFMASLVATMIIVGLTHWGGFFKPLLALLPQ
jgi:antibiotic biosynthesis monooxygenase (ABM) superfamily enzyme